MIAFTAEYAGGDLRVQEDEITEARWFGPGEPFAGHPHARVHRRPAGAGQPAPGMASD